MAGERRIKCLTKRSIWVKKEGKDIKVPANKVIMLSAALYEHYARNGVVTRDMFEEDGDEAVEVE